MASSVGIFRDDEGVPFVGLIAELQLAPPLWPAHSIDPACSAA
jgi:hypothetical protein